MVACMAGALKAGAAYLPLDPSYPADRISYMVHDAGARIVLMQHHLRDLFSGNIPVIEVDQPVFLTVGSSENLGRKPNQESPAYVIYTSGSMGRPKGVKVSHRSLLNLVLWHQRRYCVSPADRASQLASAGFDACVWELWPHLTAGAAVEIMEDEIKLAPEKLKAWLVEREITLSFLPTPLAEQLIREDWPEDCKLRAVLTGGDRLTVRPAEKLGFRVINHYGPTEATVVATAGEVAVHDSSNRLPHIGRPIPNSRVYILDNYLEPAPIGAIGELYVGGEGVALGYVHDSDPQNSRFIQNPFGAGRLYRSGDLARYLVSGEIEFIGRVDEQVKIRGYRIELGEIQAMLNEQPGIRESVVLVTEGSKGKTLTAYITPQQDFNPDLDALRAELGNRLPHYMIPSAYVVVPSLPLTANGKIDRAKLAALQPVSPTNRHIGARIGALLSSPCGRRNADCGCNRNPAVLPDAGLEFGLARPEAAYQAIRARRVFVDPHLHPEGGDQEQPRNPVRTSRASGKARSMP